MSGIAGAYLADAPGIAPFFAGPLAQALDAPPKPQTLDADIAAEIHAHNAAIGVQDPAPLDAPSVYVVTGQQTGLFTGPLYTIYKAITALKLARRIEEKHGVRCTPLFWAASEDHDFEETRAVHLLDRRHQPRKLAYAPPIDVSDRMMCGIPLDGALHALIDEAAAIAPGARDGADVAAFLHESLEAAADFSDWFSRIMARLFRDTPLQFFAPHLPNARAQATALLEREFQEPAETSRHAMEAAARLAGLGFEAQVRRAPGECNVFLVDGPHRRKITHDPEGRGFQTAGKDWDPGRALAAGARLSPNVLLRPIVQQALLKPALYAAGPGEIAYWAQLRGIFERYELPMPAVYPRASAVILSRKHRQWLDRYGIAPNDFLESGGAVEERMLRALPRSAGAEAFLAARTALLEQAGELAARFGQDERPKPWQARLRRLPERLARDLGGIESLLLRENEQAVQTVRDRRARLQQTLAPFNKPQERVYSILSFLFAEGWDLVPRLARAIGIEPGICYEAEI